MTAAFFRFAKKLVKSSEDGNTALIYFYSL
jgi:hypothetical protein